MIVGNGWRRILRWCGFRPVLAREPVRVTNFSQRALLRDRTVVVDRGTLSAITDFKAALASHPPVPGTPLPPGLVSPPGTVPPLLFETVLELIELVEELATSARTDVIV